MKNFAFLIYFLYLCIVKFKRCVRAQHTLMYIKNG